LPGRGAQESRGSADHAAQSAYGVRLGGLPLANDPATMVAITVQVVAELGYELVIAA
jgi:hypothetical protein